MKTVNQRLIGRRGKPLLGAFGSGLFSGLLLELLARSLLKRAHLFRCWTAMILIMPLMTRAASTLHMEGNVTYTAYRRDGTVAITPDGVAVVFKGRFSLASDLSRWKVRYIDDAYETYKTEQETTFDGNFAYTLFINLPLAEIQVAAKIPFPDEIIATNGLHYLNSDSAAVGALRQPVSLFASGQVAWMSLLTCGWISNPPPQLRPPWTLPGNEAGAYISRVIPPTGDGDCCAQLEFVTSQILLAAAKQGSASHAELADAPQEDFVEARFRVLTWTNVQNKCVPLEAEFVRFWFPNIQKQTGKSVRSLVRTTVSKHYFSSEPITLPALRKKTYVTDARFVTSDAPNQLVRYELTNQTWIDERDPQLARRVEESPSHSPQIQELPIESPQQPETKQRSVFIVLAFLLLAASVVIIWVVRR